MPQIEFLQTFLHACVGGVIYALKMGKVTVRSRIIGLIVGTASGTYIGPGIVVLLAIDDPSLIAATITSTGIFSAAVIEAILFVLHDKEMLNKLFDKYTK